MTVLAEDDQGTIVLDQQTLQSIELGCSYPVEVIVFVLDLSACDLLQLTDLNDLQRRRDQLAPNVNEHIALELVIESLLARTHLHRNVLDDGRLDAGLFLCQAIDERPDPLNVDFVLALIELAILAHVS